MEYLCLDRGVKINFLSEEQRAISATTPLAGAVEAGNEDSALFLLELHKRRQFLSHSRAQGRLRDVVEDPCGHLVKERYVCPLLFHFNSGEVFPGEEQVVVARALVQVRRKAEMEEGKIRGVCRLPRCSRKAGYGCTRISRPSPPSLFLSFYLPPVVPRLASAWQSDGRRIGKLIDLFKMVGIHFVDGLFLAKNILFFLFLLNSLIFAIL